MNDRIYKQVTAVILAGGQSRRMGRHKALLPYHDTTFIGDLVAHLQQLVATVVVGGCPEPGLYDGVDVQVLEDPAEFKAYGPLAGMLSAVLDCKTDYIFCVPCDNPKFPEDLLERLFIALQASGRNIAYVSDGRREQPLYVLIRTSVHQQLTDYLRSGEKRVFGWMQSMNPLVVDFSDEQDYFYNINSEEEYKRFIAEDD